MHWIKKWMPPVFDGLNELYHHAKFGEVRTMHTSCRCKNVVFVAGCHKAANCRYLNLLTGQKSGFSPCRGDSLHRFTSNLAGRRARGSTWLCKILPQSPQGWECGPKNIKNFHFLVKSRVVAAISLTDFENFKSLTILHYCGKLPVLNLLSGQKSGFSPHRGTRCTDSRQTWQGRRARGSAWLCKILPQSPQWMGMWPTKYQKFPLFGKESPHRGDSLYRF